MPFNRCVLAAGATGAVMLAAGCGSASPSASPSASTGAVTGTPSTAAASRSAGSSGQPAGALSADARSKATGDIPDQQVFLVLNNAAAGYSMKYPEGWTQIGAAANVTVRDKNNLIHVTMTRGMAPSPASMAAQFKRLQRSNPTLKVGPPRIVGIGGARVVKAVYSTESAVNPVTGRRVLLLVDRYEIGHAGKVATVDLGTPKGVDNVDAYRMIINSFHWR
jgi:hypothetical protein